MSIRLIAVSFGLAIAAAVFLLVWPIYSGFDGNRATLLQVNGPWVVVPVVFPILILLFPLIFHKRAVRIIATILIGGFVLVSGFSIGVLYLPAAFTMLLATCLTPPADATNVSQ